MSRTRDELIFLRSQDATYDSNFDFSFKLKKGLRSVKSLQLISYNIPYAFPNISEFDNSLKFVEEGNTKTVTITPGTYDVSSLVVAIKSAMDTASTSGNTFTVSFSDITYCISITASTTEFTILKDGTTLAHALGMTDDLVSSSRKITFQHSVDLLTSKEIQLHLPGIVRNYESQNRDQTSDLLMLVPITGDAYTYLSNSYPGVELETLTSELYMITLMIVDQTGYTPHGWLLDQYPFSLVLKATVFV